LTGTIPLLFFLSHYRFRIQHLLSTLSNSVLV
jgi:hypothetical protein